MKIYKNIFEKEMNTDLGKYCMVKISDCYIAVNEIGLDEYFEQLLSDKYEDTDLKSLRIELQNKTLLREGKYDLVLTNLEELSSNKNFSGVTLKNNLYNKALLYLNCYNDYSKAKEVFAEFENEYPNDRLNDDASLLLNTSQYYNEENKSLAAGNLSKGFSLLDNYPNPFNPSTIISYTLPYQSSVELTIYDIMGGEVKSFSVIQSAGTQNIVWNGTNSNNENVSSGIYIYKIRLKSLENNEVFEKSAKLMMLK